MSPHMKFKAGELKDKTVTIICCGGNIDPDTHAEIIKTCSTRKSRKYR